MLIRISGGASGIKAYLETGQKQGRESTREQLDERVILKGDLEIADAIISTVSGDGDKYLHITLSFKEDHIPRDMLEAIVDDFEQFAFSAYRKDEYSFYAEAHLPKIKGYASEKTGDVIERKPHIHIVIPKINLLTGKVLNPFGLVDNNIVYIDAFQEHINNKYGLSSPKENRRITFNSASEMISRHKGDIFDPNNKDAKSVILAEIVDKNITDYKTFVSLLQTKGAVRIRNEGSEKAYCNLKFKDAAKGINLKEYVFSEKFISLSTDEKKSYLARDIAKKYEQTSSNRRDPETIRALLSDWGHIKAMETKYINTGNRTFYNEYRNKKPDDKRSILLSRDATHYAKFGATTQQRNRSNDQQHANNNATQANFSPPPKRAQTSHLNNMRSLSSIAMVCDTHDRNMLLQGPMVKQLDNNRAGGNDALRSSLPRTGEGRGGSDEPQRRRSHVSAADQYHSDHNEDKRQTAAASDFKVIKATLKASRLLAFLSHTHGLDPAKYTVSQAKDGSDRIVCGRRNLNVSDFLTKEMNLPWLEAADILKKTYAEQIGLEPERSKKTAPNKSLWEQYRNEKNAANLVSKQAWSDQRLSEKLRIDAITTSYTDKDVKIGDGQNLTGEKRAELFTAQIQRNTDLAAVKKTIALERAALQNQHPPRSYIDFLASSANAGNLMAFDELHIMTAGDSVGNIPAFSISSPLSNRVTLHPTKLAKTFEYSVCTDGSVLYSRNGKNILRDTDTYIELIFQDKETIELALRLAYQKYGNRLSLQGNDAFCAKVATTAAEIGLDVTFDQDHHNRAMVEALKVMQPVDAREAQSLDDDDHELSR